jgi:toxin ParE1/3/4
MSSPSHGSASPHATVDKFALSARAEAELIEIYEHSATRFGPYQAEAYLAGLERTFGLLADFPKIGQPVDDLAPGYRRFRFQVHLVFYTEEADRIVIRAVIHGSRDIRPALFD